MAFTFMLLSLILSFAGFYKATFLSMTFWAPYLLVHIVFILSFIGISEVSAELALLFLFFSGITLLAQLVEHNRFSHSDAAHFVKNSHRVSLGWHLLLAIFTFGVSIIVYIVGSGGLSGVSRSWIYIAASRNVFDTILTNLSVLLYIICLIHLQIIFFSKNSIKNKMLALSLLLIFATIYGVFFRAKSMLLPAIVPVFIIWFYVMKENSVKKYLSVMFIAAFSILFYFILTAFRWMGEFETFSVDRFFDVLIEAILSGFERNLVYQSSVVFQAVLDKQIFLYGGAYIKLMLLPFSIISSFYMQNPMYEYFTLLGGVDGVMRGSAHPTIVVDAFASFSYLGVAIGFCWIFLIRSIYIIVFKHIGNGAIIYLCILSYSMPLVVRGSVYLGMLYFVLLIIFLRIYHLFVLGKKSFL